MAITGYRNKFITGEVGDTGMSQADPMHGMRMMNSNGTFNVENIGTPGTLITDLYLDLVRMKWWQFILLLAAFIVGVNLFFTAIYLVAGIQFITGLPGGTFIADFLKAYLFSLQSFTTSGFGLVSTNSGVTFIGTFEAVCGLLIFALATGLIFGRFSRPSARIVHSENAVIAPYKNGKALMFRICNGRKKYMIANLEWFVMVAFNQQMGNRVVRRFHDLKLEVSKGLFFPLSWTIVHPIDEESPLFNLTEQDYTDGFLEVMAIVNGFDETFHQNVHTKFGYLHDEIIWGAKFILNFEAMPTGKMRHYVNKVGNIEKVVLPD